MAGTPVTKLTEFLLDSDMDHLRLSHNLLLDDLAIQKNALSGSAAVAVATDPTKVKSTAAVTGTLNGVAVVSKAATDPEWALGGANAKTPVPSGFTQKYILYRDVNNVATVQEGKMAATAAGVTFPVVDGTNQLIVGVMQVVNTSGAPFIPGTTSLAAAGIATTFTQQAADPALQFRAYKVLKLQ